METFWQDIKFGVRTLLKKPALTIVVALTLGLGIGANTAMFSVVNAMLYRPLPVHDAHQIVALGVSHPENENPHNLSYPDYLDYREQSDAFSHIAGYFMTFVGISSEGNADRVIVSYVSDNYFTMFGIEPAVGRLILPSDGMREESNRVVVLGHSYWQNKFGGDPGVVGAPVKINGEPFTVVGVVPENFTGAFAVAEMEAYLPLGLAPLIDTFRTTLDTRDSHSLRTLGRLKEGVSIEQARASLEVIAHRLESQYSETNAGVVPVVKPETAARPNIGIDGLDVVGTIFLAMVGLVLVVACINVANVLLVSATVRQKELAVRAAMGASRMRLVRQLLTESFLISIIGGAAGVVLGAWASGLLSSIRMPGDIPIRFDFSFDWTVYGYAMAAAMATTLLIGVAPALRASKADVNATLREGGRSPSGQSSRHGLRNLLVVGQVAGSLVLLITAGLFVRSMQKAEDMDLGMEPRNLLTMLVAPSLQGYDQQRSELFFDEVQQRVRALPGVESAALSYSLPMGYFATGGSVYIEGQPPPTGETAPSSSYNIVSEAYFRTMGIPIVEGRPFTEEEVREGRPVAVINAFMAKRYWPDRSPLGQRFALDDRAGTYLEVIGVSPTGRYNNPVEDPQTYLYIPASLEYRSVRVLQIRTTIPPTQLINPVRAEIQQMDAAMPVYDVLTMEESLQGANGFFLFNMGAMLAGVMGALGLILAAVGVYAVVSFSANQRTHEIGVRMALGAQRGSIFRLVVGQGFILTLIGVGVGLAIAAGITRFLGDLLIGISPTDPVTFGTVSAVLIATALLASYAPARRATNVDPMVALRYE